MVVAFVSRDYRQDLYVVLRLQRPDINLLLELALEPCCGYNVYPGRRATDIFWVYDP